MGKPIAPAPPVTTANRGFGWEPGTMRKAALLGGAVAVLVGIGAWFVSEPTAKGPLAGYLRLGTSGGAAALQHELLADFPPGSPVPPLLQRVQGMGLRCTAPAPGAAGWNCTARLQYPGRAQMNVEVLAGSDQDRITAVDVAFFTQAP